MKVKLDENLGEIGAAFLKASGVDVATVADQGRDDARWERMNALWHAARARQSVDAA